VSQDKQKETREWRNLLNRQIEELCQEFYDKTGLRVDSINLDRAQSLCGKLDYTWVETIVKL
jgi:hypothetical protein